MVLYHGSSSIIKRPTFGKGNPHNDYGLGFYCTEHLDLALEWACTEENSGFANKYEIDTSDLKVCHLQMPGYHILNWLAILLDNRNLETVAGLQSEGKKYILGEFLPDVSQADIIIGYRADDSYFSFAKAFLNGTISLSQLSGAMRLGALGEQVVLMSQKAFEKLSFLEAIPADNYFYGARRRNRDVEARRKFQELSRPSDGRQSLTDEVYIIDIIRQQWKNDDPRLR